MTTTYTLRYRLSTRPEYLQSRDFTSKEDALTAARQLNRKKFYDITINWEYPH